MDKNSDNIFKDGICVVTLSLWQDFHQEVLNLKSKRGFVWRGQSKDWPLQSSFDRNVKSKNQHDRAKELKRHLDNFKEKMNISYPNILPQDNVNIWALGQHYGLKTPLLDWTLSPYIAAYFAFLAEWNPSDPDDTYRYVYALNRSLERLILKQASEILPASRSVLFIDQLPHANPRFLAQMAILMEAFRGNKVNKYVKIFSRKKPSEEVLVKFKIPTKYRDECLHQLHLMNINHTSLLLDLRDVIDRCNRELYDSGHGASVS